MDRNILFVPFYILYTGRKRQVDQIILKTITRETCNSFTIWIDLSMWKNLTDLVLSPEWFTSFFLSSLSLYFLS